LKLVLHLGTKSHATDAAPGSGPAADGNAANSTASSGKKKKGELDFACLVSPSESLQQSPWHSDSNRIRCPCLAGKKALKQTEPPSIPLAALFPDGVFPEGEWQPYKNE